MILAPLAIALVSAAPFELEWEAPASCSNRPDTVELVGAATGRAEVQLREREAQWVVTVMFFEPTEGLRRVVVASCEEAIRTAGLIVKLGSRGEFATKRVEPTAAPPSEPRPAMIAHHDEPTEPWKLTVGAGAALDVGTLPLPEPRLALTGLLSRASLGVAADVRFGAAQPVADARVLHLVELQAAVCVLPSVGQVRIGSCVSSSVGSWRLSTFSGAAKGLLVASSGLQARVLIPLSEHVEAGVLAGVRLNLIRPMLRDDTGSLFETPLAVGDLQLTLGWRW